MLPPQLLFTQSLSFTDYLDLWMFNGKQHSFWMTRSEEQKENELTNYEVKKHIEGNGIETFYQEFKKENEKAD